MPAVKANVVNAQAAPMMLTVVGQVEANRGSTTALVISSVGSLRRARCDLLARRAIRHVVVNVNVGMLSGREMEIRDGKATLILATRDRGTRIAGDFSFNAFALLVSAWSTRRARFTYRIPTRTAAMARTVGAREARKAEAAIRRERPVT